MKLSVVIPARNEARNIGPCLDELRLALDSHGEIPYELIVVDDNSDDETASIVEGRMRSNARIRLVRRAPPAGFGRAIRAGVEAAGGDVVVICMADMSDDPNDLLAYYSKIVEGYDCVYGSRFIRGSQVQRYPRLKLALNRVVNRTLQVLFWCEFNDLTNAFKAYRRDVLRDCGPYRACHFDITLEMSLGALVRRCRIAQIPIRWRGRTWGSSKLRLREMGPKYFRTALTMFCRKLQRRVRNL